MLRHCYGVVPNNMSLSLSRALSLSLGVEEDIADMTYLFKMSREQDLSKLLPAFIFLKFSIQ